VNGQATAYAVAERAARESYGKLLAFLAVRCGVERAEDALSDAFSAALERWPLEGVPRVPEAWILVAARNRVFDETRREKRTQLVHDRLAAAHREAQVTIDAAREIDDERLGVLFACAHPAIAESIRAPLILQVVLGLEAARIASAFLVAPATMSQRLVRAKRKIAASKIPLAVPSPDVWPERLDAILRAIYAAFGEGWDAASGSDPETLGLANEALWLGRLLATVRPHDPEVLGLVALMLYVGARREARRDASGSYVPLDRQDVALWNTAAIAEAEALLLRAARGRCVGRFQLEAAIQSVHVARRNTGSTDWEAIVTLYDALLATIDSPVVALNRIAALSRSRGASVALVELSRIEDDRRLLNYQPYWATRADLCARAGRSDEAHAAYTRALGLTIDPALRRHLTNQLELPADSPAPLCASSNAARER
jgi:RNA polymerase sigma-70 factor (ECF subfamily)